MVKNVPDFFDTWRPIKCHELSILSASPPKTTFDTSLNFQTPKILSTVKST